MSIEAQAQSINNGIVNVKSNLTTALANKNVTVPANTKLKDYPAFVDSIEVGESADLTNLIPENVKVNVDINGVVGTFTSDANATSEQILHGYWAYARGELVDGSIMPTTLTKTGVLTATVNKGYVSDDETVTFSDSNLIADNIKSGVAIFGVTGTYEGESSGGATVAYVVTEAGNAEANGYYIPTGETRTVGSYGTYPIYKNGNGIYMYFSDQCGYSWMPGWCLSPNIIDSGDGMLYCTQCGEGASQYPTGMLESWSTLDGTTPYPKCYACDENGNPIIPPDYIVSGAGTEIVNGDYKDTGLTQGGYKIYKNENDVYLFYYTMMGGWVFGTDYTSESSSTWYYHCEAYGEVTTGNWENDALYPTVDSLGAEPLPTVTKN